LFSDLSRPTQLGTLAIGICDEPVTFNQLDLSISLIFNFNGIAKAEVGLIRYRLFREITWIVTDQDFISHG